MAREEDRSTRNTPRRGVFGRWGRRLDAAAPERRLDAAGAVAVEFAFLGPLFIVLIFASVVYGTIFGILHQLEGLASSSARYAVAGLSDEERSRLVDQYVQKTAGSLSLIDATKLKVTVSTTDAATRSYTVDVGYDMSGAVAYSFAGVLPLPDPYVHRVVVMQRGGY
ncbi:MAG: pilus assembly protein [Phyllobacteriaceae bacterium]|nr:pilus assembly protein [Phyllobacteriaceae bacterium]